MFQLLLMNLVQKMNVSINLQQALPGQALTLCAPADHTVPLRDHFSNVNTSLVSCSFRFQYSAGFPPSACFFSMQAEISATTSFR
jgi:hypothetical protein